MTIRYRRNCSIKEKLLERFYLNGDCWEYMGRKDADGYGRIWHEKRNQTVHTVAYATFVGEIPLEKQVLHSCDNPVCYNPAHLSLGTHLENMHHKSIRKRIHGEKNPMSLVRQKEREMKKFS